MLDRTERQKEGIRRWLKAKGHGTCVYSTGFGKTNTARLLISALIKKNPSLSVLVSVPTEELLKQWEDVVIKNNLIKNVHVGIINSIVKNEYEVDLLVIDEVHSAASEVFSHIFSCVKYKYILCLTATLERLDGKEELIKKYAPVCDTITFEEAIRNGWLSPVKEYKVLVDVDLTEYREHHAEFLKHFAIFNFDFSVAMNCATGRYSKYQQLCYAKTLCHYQPSDPRYRRTLDELVQQVRASAYSWMRAMQARKQFVNKHPKKIELARKILDARPNAKAITFSSTIAEAEKIGRGFVYHSGQTKKKRGMTMEEFKTCSKGVLNSSKAIDVGLDVPDVNLAIILSGSSSNIQKVQRKGRAARYVPGKTSEVFSLVIKGTNDEKWFNSASKGTKYITISEEELDIVLREGDIETRQRDNENTLYLG